MGGDTRFWYFFGGIWFFVGASFLFVSIGLPSLLDPATLNQDGPPLWVFSLIGLACAGAGGTIIWWARKTAAHDKRLMESGITLKATVTDIQESPIRINRQTRWTVCYRYEYSGRALNGKSRALPGPEAADFKPGQEVRIKADPRNPEDSLFLGAVA